MRPEAWYGQAMASDKERLQAWLEKMNADEIRETLPLFGGKKKSAAFDELAAREWDQELKSRPRKETVQRTVVLVVVVIAACTLIALIILTAALLLSGLLMM